MRLDFSEEEWEVALTEFSCRNRERLDVEVLAKRSDDNDYLEVFPLPAGIYDSKLELVSEAYDILSTKTVVADRPTIDFMYEECHLLRHVYGRGGFRVYHHIVQNENLVRFSDSNASVFDSFLDFFTFLQDTYCIKIDTGNYSSQFDYNARATFVKLHNGDGNGNGNGNGVQSVKTDILVSGQKATVFNGRLENVTFVVTRTLASFLHWSDKADFSKYHSSDHLVSLHKFSANNKDFVVLEIRKSGSPGGEII